jgi:hypothetical protein
MVFDKLFLCLLVLFIYGPICIVAIIFTFSLGTYTKIHSALDFNVIYAPIINPLERGINWFDSWAMKHHRIIGPVLIFLSIVDLRLLLELINSF